MASILIVDDDKNILYFLKEVLAKLNHQLVTADSGVRALEILEKQDFDLIVSDLQMPWVDGIGVLKTSKKKNPYTEVLILTGYGSIKSAVRAMKSGAFEYLQKPVDVDELRMKVAQALEHREMKIKLDEYNEMIARDLRLAEQVQQSLVPLAVRNERIEVGVKYSPMIGVGGDYADIYYDGNRFIYLTIVDVTGHGITAALLVNRVCNELRKLIRDRLEPSDILANLNNFIVEIFFNTGMFMTMFSCMIDLDEQKCIYAGAAHPAVILWQHQTNEYQQLPSQNSIIGFEKKDKDQLFQNSITIHPGDKLILYTDGVIEIEDTSKKPVGVNGLMKFLKKSIHLTPVEIPELIVEDLMLYSQRQIRDDIFLIVAEIK